MCKVCIQWEKGKLTDKEAIRTSGEMIQSFENDEETVQHYWDLVNKILDKSTGTNDSNQEMDETWWKETHEE